MLLVLMRFSQKWSAVYNFAIGFHLLEKLGAEKKMVKMLISSMLIFCHLCVQIC